MKNYKCFAYALVSVLLVLECGAAIAQNKKIERSCPFAFQMHKKGGTQKLRYASNHSLTSVDTSIETLLVYIHGINRNGVDYFEYGERMLRAVNKKKETLLIAPQYADAEDLDYYQLGNDFLYWKKTEWKDGHTSISTDNRPQGLKISSYEVLDSLLTAILSSNKFPNIKKVVIVGHSAGGQFVQRYSTITPVPDRFTQYKFRFLVMDPSSYMYLDARRPLADKTFGMPDTAGCPEYNDYPKGLIKLNTYAKAIGAENIKRNLMQRDIVILLGEKDTKTDDPNLDVSCAGNLQGRFRLERGLNYVSYLSAFPEYEHKGNYNIVAGSGHNGDTMINSDEAKKWIFGKGN
jgi:pimeloyl-ACP methyl ester carboxylesterase